MNTGTPAAIAVAFTHALRHAGVAVPTRCTHTYADALATTGLGTRDGVYWAGRATLIHRPEDIGAYDDTFARFFDGHRASEAERADVLQVELLTDRDDDDDADDADADGDSLDEHADDDAITLRWSSAETLRHKDFAEYTHEELLDAHQLMAELRFAGDRHTSLRREASPRPTAVPDVRRTVRAAMRSAGEPIARHHRRRTTRLRRLVLLLDVSGSMEPYARALLRFVQAAVAGRQRVEAFALGTRLTRVTRELGARDPDAALRAATDRVHDWSGGTRLGPCLRAFNDQWGIRGMARGATVVILSDGWDRGDPEQLAAEMQRLGRVAHRVIWVNPLKTTPGYAPLARGMAAALPHVDDFVEGHSVDALEQLAALVAGTTTTR
ncbi:MAG: VWA domain-containing protein [Actinomycetota bacterium]